MLFGYYDRNGYPNIYTGPTNGGVFPLTNEMWGHAPDGFGQCPLSASQLGLDNRTIKGHKDDYYYKIHGSTDPYYGNWAEHAPDSLGDFMGTSQYQNWQTKDGWTDFFFYTNGSPLYDYTGSESGHLRDGTHGMKLFAESQGYRVETNYNQYIDGYHNNTQGFTYAQYKSEIDAGYPVYILMTEHSMLGVGYTGTDEIIIHDSWSYNNHVMTWGEPYGWMDHIGVSVIHLVPIPPVVQTLANGTVTRTTAILNGNLTSTGSGGTTVWFGYSSTPGGILTNTTAVNQESACLFTAPITGLNPASTYYYYAFASNRGGTINGTMESFTTSNTLLPVAPVIQTLANGTVSSKMAVLNGNLTNTGYGEGTWVWFGYSSTPGGTLTNTTPMSKETVGLFNSTLTGLNPDSTYYYYAFASNVGGTVNGTMQSFTTTPAPTVTGFEPTSAYNSYLLNATIRGTNFMDGAQIYLSYEGHPDWIIYNSSPVRYVNSTCLAEQFDIMGVNEGVCSVKVTNPDGGEGSLASIFTIKDAWSTRPWINSITPESAYNNTIVEILLNGTFFSQEMEVHLAKRYTYKASRLNTTPIYDPKTGNISASFDLNGLPAQEYDIWVTNTTTKAGSVTIQFSIHSPVTPVPVMYSISPSLGQAGTTVPFTITGSNLTSGAQVNLTQAGQSNITATGTLSGSNLTGMFNLPSEAATGPWNVTVNQNGTYSNNNISFTITAAPVPATSFIINATANTFAIIKPAGLVPVRRGDTIDFTVQAKAGASLSNLSVDAEQVPIPVNNRYSFTNVTGNHTIYLDAALKSGVILASFKANCTSGTSPLTVRFTDTSGGNPTQWSWNFGDGQISTIQNPVHVYTKPGTFTVSLFVRNALSNNLKRKTGMIRVTP